MSVPRGSLRHAMQNPQSEGSPQRSSSGKDGGFAARIEAAAKSSAPQPVGKGIAMVVLGVLVVAAVVFEMLSDRGTKPARQDDKPPIAGQGDPAKAPDKPDARFDLPGDLPGPLANEIALALTAGAHEAEEVFKPGLRRVPELFTQVPADLRAATRKRLLAHLATIADGKARGAALQAATPLVQALPAREAADARRLTLLAELALEDDAAVRHALVFLSALPTGVRPAASIEAVALDPKRKLAVRISAVHALPSAERSEALRKLADDEKTPQELRNALK